MLEIVLPHSEDGFYRFGDLPWLIGKSLVPDDESVKDWIRCVRTWKADRSAEGTFFQRIAPDGVLTDELEVCNSWSAAPIDLSQEPEDRSRSNLFHWLWHEQRRSPEWHRYLDDGSIVIHVDQEPESLRLGVDKLMHEKQYESALRAAVDSSQLVVCNSSGLPQTFTLGRALLDSVIHIDELNRWGTAQQGGQRFSMAVEHPHAGLSPMADGLWFIADAAFALAQQEGMGAEGRVHLCKRMAECAGFPAEHGHHLPTRHLHSKLTRKHTEEHALATGVYPTDVNDWLEAICAPYRWEPNGAVKDRLAAQRALKAEHRKKHEPPPPEKVIRSPLGTVAAIDMIARRELPQKAMTSTTSKGVSQGSKTASPSNDLATDESGGVSDSPSTWQLNKPERYQGYTRPLYELLKAAHLAAHAKPSARDVVEAFRTNQPPEIAKVLADSFDFYDAAGNTKSANVAAVAQAIRRMTTVRPR